MLEYCSPILFYQIKYFNNAPIQIISHNNKYNYLTYLYN